VHGHSIINTTAQPVLSKQGTGGSSKADDAVTLFQDRLHNNLADQFTHSQVVERSKIRITLSLFKEKVKYI
jgi:hypothetical protein